MTPPTLSSGEEHPGTREHPTLTDARQAATAARRVSGALAEAPAVGRLP